MHNDANNEQITYREILLGYLEKPLPVVLDRKSLQRWTKRETGVVLNQSALDNLYNCLCELHEDKANTAVSNIDNFKLQTSWGKGEDVLGNTKVSSLLGSLKELQHSMDVEIQRLDKVYARDLRELERLVEEIDSVGNGGNAPSDDDNDDDDDDDEGNGNDNGQAHIDSLMEKVNSALSILENKLTAKIASSQG
ncbi:hypothetical protein DAMA08_045460 [Martiniozyma asiatica (nom. inval.)]|nr:hypothetical protein DAMA08_045460 [Martiniozyma asiatica]